MTLVQHQIIGTFSFQNVSINFRRDAVRSCANWQIISNPTEKQKTTPVISVSSAAGITETIYHLATIRILYLGLDAISNTNRFQTLSFLCVFSLRRWLLSSTLLKFTFFPIAKCQTHICVTLVYLLIQLYHADFITVNAPAEKGLTTFNLCYIF